MRKTVFLWLLLVSMITVVLVLPTTLILFYHTYENRIEEDLMVELTSIESYILNGGDYTSLNIGGRRLTLIDEEGVVLFDSSADESSMENHLDREEVREALENGIGESERRSDTLSLKSVYSAKRIQGNMVLRISTEAKTLFSFLSLLIVPLLFTLIIVFLLMIVFSRVISKRIVEPINTLNLDLPEENDTYDELSPLLVRLKKEKDRVKEEITKSQEKKKEFELISSSLEEGLCIVSLSGEILSYNKSFLTLMRNGEEKGSSVFAYFESGEGKKTVLDALGGKRSESVLSVDGRMIEEVAYPSGKGIVILLRDVTERVERENMRREFTANVSHELKTPLTTISGFAELLMSGSVPEDKVVDFSQDIYREAERLINLVSDILNLSSLDEGSESVEETINLKTSALDVSSELSLKAENAGVETILNLEDVFLKGSSKLLHEIIYNLMDNAIRYKGSLSPKVEVITKKKGDRAFLAVEDNGIGIPKEHQSRIFERFYRVDKARSKSEGGTGLGLSIVKNATLLMKGEINLSSAPGKGTSVEISFPRAD